MSGFSNDSTAIKVTTPALYTGMKLVEYGKEVAEATKNVPKNEVEAPMFVKSAAGGVILGYEYAPKIAAGAKKVYDDANSYITNRAKENVKDYENLSNTEKVIAGPAAKIVYWVNKLIAE